MDPASTDNVDVGGVIGPHRRRHLRIVEQPTTNRQFLVGRCRHQHDVDQPGLDNLLHLIAVVGQRPESEFAIVAFRRSSRRAHSEGHVRILGIGQDELAAA